MKNKLISALVVAVVCLSVPLKSADATDIGNFGLPGLFDLPTAKALPADELVITQQLHASLARSGASFQVLPKLGVAFRYSGHGKHGDEANGRENHDRSFDLHLTLWDEGLYRPGVAVGLRDFIGTGWYSSEYIVATKSIGDFELTTGLGFGRLAGRNSFANPFGAVSQRFETRETNDYGRGGTLGTINWFHGKTSPFSGLSYRVNDRLALSVEYSPDLMLREKTYLGDTKPLNLGASYRINNATTFSAQYLYGSTLSVTANFALNPLRPPHNAGRETAPVPFRARNELLHWTKQTDEATIRKVLQVDGFEVISFDESDNKLRLDVVANRYRSIAQSIGRITSTLQRFSANDVQEATIVFYRGGLQLSSFNVNLNTVTPEQYGKQQKSTAIIATDNIKPALLPTPDKDFIWALRPYITHRLFNPDLPLSMEIGAEVAAKYRVTPKLSFDSAFRKSIITNLTDNNRAGHGASSGIPTTQSDWGLYDINGQGGHINHLSLNYVENMAQGYFGRIHAGLLEPFWAGIGAEILYMPANAPFALGLDIHRVQKRNYDMLFALQEYATTTGHVSLYFDAGGLFDFEVNAGRYLAKDWGATTRISRQFANGWEVGGYATFTDVAFEDFGEGSFDKGIYVKIPMDWLSGKPDRSRRYFEIRPITKDGGARLGTARVLYQRLKEASSVQFSREYGRTWK